MNSQGAGGLRVHSHRLQDADIAEEEIKDEGVLTDSFGFVADEYSRFLAAAKQDEKEAWKRIQETAAFREREKVDGLLEQPHPHFFC
eukprot:jgi/Picre1/35238/NNA_002700.t1